MEGGDDIYKQEMIHALYYHYILSLYVGQLPLACRVVLLTDRHTCARDH